MIAAIRHSAVVAALLSFVWPGLGQGWIGSRRRAILFAVRLSENLARDIPLHLVYRDDASTPLPPENVPGTQPLVGFEGHHIEKLQGGRYQFALHIFGLPGFQPGDQRPILAGLDQPVTAAVTGSDAGTRFRPSP